MFFPIESANLVNLVFVYLLVGIRFLGMLYTSAAMMSETVPEPVRFWLAFMLALIVVPLVDIKISTALLGSWVFLFILAVREFVIGAAVGFFVGLPIYAMQASGYFDGMQMGLSMMNVFDPMSQGQVNLLGQVKYLLAVWFFFHWDGHLLLVQSVRQSLEIVPVGIGELGLITKIPWGRWLQNMFEVALRMSLPIMSSLLLAEIGLGFIARTVPQMNVFTLGIPLKIGLGLILLIVVLPMMVDVFHTEIEKALRMTLEGISQWR